MIYGSIILFGRVRTYLVLKENGDDVMKRMQPMIAIEGRSPHATLGVGFRILVDNELPISRRMPQEQPDIIHAWRAMKLLERVTRVDNQGKALVASIALFNAARAPHALDAEYIRELAGHFGGQDYLSKAVADIKATIPPEADLDALVHEIHQAGILINAPALVNEMRHFGRNVNTAVIHEVMSDYEKILAGRRKKSAWWERLLEALAKCS
jgi:hypothetical protein